MSSPHHNETHVNTLMSLLAQSAIEARVHVTMMWRWFADMWEEGNEEEGVLLPYVGRGQVVTIWQTAGDICEV